MATCEQTSDAYRPNVSLADRISPGEQSASVAAFVVTIVLNFASMVFFLIKKNNYARTRVRVGLFSTTYFFADAYFMIGWVAPIAVGVDRFPCWLSFACLTLSMGYFNATNFTRNTTFMLMTGLSYATESNGRISLDQIAEVEDQLKNLTPMRKMKENIMLIGYGLSFVFRPEAVKGRKSSDEHIRMLVSLRFITSWGGSILFTLAILAPYLVALTVVVLVVPVYREGCTGCIPDSRANVYATVVLAGILLSFATLFNAKCSSLPDVFGVFAEETMSAGSLVGCFLGFLLISFADISQRYYLNLLIAFTMIPGYFATTGLQIILARRGGRTKVINTTDDGGKNGKMASASYHESTSSVSSVTIVQDIKTHCPRLHEILGNSEHSKMFGVLVLREFCDENLNFLHDSAEWRRTHNDIARSASTARAKKIVNSFIREGGLQQVNVSYAAAHKLTRKADQVMGDFDQDAFDEARIEVARLLENGCVARFVDSKEFKSTQSNLAVINAVTHAGT